MSVPRYLLGRRAIFAGIAFAALAVLALGWFAIAALLAPADGSADDAVDRLARLEAEAAARPQVSTALAALSNSADARLDLLKGDSDALAQSTMQSDIKTMVESNGGEVRSANALPPAPEQGLSRISVQYDIVVPLSKLRALIYGIESHAPYLFLSAVDIAAPQTWPTAKDAPEPKTEVRWTVSGYRRSTVP